MEANTDPNQQMAAILHSPEPSAPDIVHGQDTWPINGPLIVISVGPYCSGRGSNLAQALQDLQHINLCLHSCLL